MTETTVEKLIEGARTDAVFDEVYRKSGLRRAMAEALFRLRKAADLTQAALGEKAKWAQPYVARLERGEANSISALEGIERYANACGVSAMVLFVDPRTLTVQSSVALGEEPAMKAFAGQLEGASVLQSPPVPVVLQDMQAVVDEAQSTVNSAIQEMQERISRITTENQAVFGPLVARDTWTGSDYAGRAAKAVTGDWGQAGAVTGQAVGSGIQPATDAMKSAVAAVNAAYNSLSNATRQAIQMTEANVSAATNAAEKSATQASGLERTGQVAGSRAQSKS